MTTRNYKKEEDTMNFFQIGFTYDEIGQVKLPELKHEPVKRQRILQILQRLCFEINNQINRKEIYEKRNNRRKTDKKNEERNTSI